MLLTRKYLTALALAMAASANSAAAGAAAFECRAAVLHIQDPDDPKTSSADLRRLAREKHATAKLLANELGKTEEASNAYREGCIYLFDVILRGDAGDKDKALHQDMLGQHVKLLAKLGREDEARSLLERFLDPREWPQGVDWGYAQSLIKSASKIPSLQSTLAKFRSIPIDTGGRSEAGALENLDPRSPDIDAQVMAAAVQGRVDFVWRIGERAAPGLIQLINQQRDRYYEESKLDPLNMLYRVSPLEADAYVGQFIDPSKRSLLLNLRLASAFQHTRIFHKDWQWKRSSEGKFICLLPNTLRICGDLLMDEQTSSEAAEALAFAARREHYTPAMLRYLEEHAGQGDRAGFVRRWLSESIEIPSPELYPILLRTLTSAGPDVREDMVRALLRYPTREGLMEALPQLHESVRATAITWLASQELRRKPQVPSEDWTETYSWTPPRDTKAQVFVDRLLADPSPEVRLATLEQWRKLPRQWETISEAPYPGNLEGYTYQNERPIIDLQPRLETLLALAQDKDARIRQALVERFILVVPSEHYEPVLLKLAETDTLLSDDNFRLLDWREQSTESIEIVKQVAQVASTRSGFSRENFFENCLRKGIQRAIRTPQGLQACAQWAVDEQSSALAQHILGTKHNSPNPLHVHIAPRTWAEMLVLWAYTEGQDVNPVQGLVPVHRNARKMTQANLSPQHHQAVLDLLTEHQELPLDTRAVLLLATSQSEDERFAAALAKFLEEASFEAFNRYLWLKSDLSKALANRRRDLSFELALTLVDRGNLNGILIKERILNCLSFLQLKPRLITSIQAHAPALGYGPGLVQDAVTWMGSHPEHADRDWLRSMLGKADLKIAVLNTIGQLGDLEFLPDLSQIIREDKDKKSIQAATKALGHFLNDEAAELLLVAARRTPDAQLRTWCLAQLEEIRILQEAEGRWAERRIQEASREATVSKLMELLDKGNQAARIEAIHALATWKAIEAMPQLIGLLSDPSPDVAKAAKQALAELNQR